MVVFKPVKYGKRNYPAFIKPQVEEIAGHFDVQKINPRMNYSIHTEYSYRERKFSSISVLPYSTLRNSNKNFIPLLWFNDSWSQEFALYIKDLVGDNKAPEVIEIHPPFNDYCRTIDQFIDIYSSFEKNIHSFFPDTIILLENRYGSLYRGGRFLVSNLSDIEKLVKLIDNNKLKLRLTLDIIQLFGSHSLNPNAISPNVMLGLFNRLKDIRDYINGYHIWGKKPGNNGRYISHYGNLDDYFADISIKQLFIQSTLSLFDDDMTRYFVPEVNSNDEDLMKIVMDYIDYGVNFL